MDNPLKLSTAASGSSKDSFIHQAHEARQARELARRRNKAATTVQAFLRACHSRRQLKSGAEKELAALTTDSSAQIEDREFLVVLRKLLFVCHPSRDRKTLDTLLQHILVKLTQRIDKPTDDACELSVSSHLTTIINQAELPHKGEQLFSPHEHGGELMRCIVQQSSTDERELHAWTLTIIKLVNLCVWYLGENNSTPIDNKHISMYLQLINAFALCATSENQPDAGSNPCRTILSHISNRVYAESLNKNDFFRVITNLICDRLNKLRNDPRADSILYAYTRIALHQLIKPNPPSGATSFSSKSERENSETLMTMLSIPGFIKSLENLSPKSLQEFNAKSIFSLALRSLNSDIYLQKLTSSTSVCLLANLIHLGSLNEATLALETSTFVILAGKLLDCCRKNMSKSDKRPIKERDHRNLFFNPILGWLTGEPANFLDKDVLVSQLNRLWSAKMLRVLFRDLLKANERVSTLTRQNSGGKSSTCGSKQRGFSFGRKSSTDNSPGLSCDQVSTQQNIFRRAVEKTVFTVEKTVSTVGRTFNSSYVKTGVGTTNSGSARLLTEEANRIALVCLMFLSALRALTTLKQDILTSLCQDYILLNLWKFISSLGPNNGLKAFLEHLTIHTKTSAPEFHILTLFCECSSHIMSVLDDSELYEQQRPFSIEDLLDISNFLNLFVYRVIFNNLIPTDTTDMDPILQTTHKLLVDLYRRDCRRKFAPQDHWLVKEVKISLFLRDLEAGKPHAQTILSLIPHVIPHKERVLIFRRLVAKDKSQYRSAGNSTFITINRSRIVEDGYQQLTKFPPQALKGLIRVKFINDHGLDEAGIDQDGVFKEFLEDAIRKVFDPALNLFCSTSEQRLYPSPTSCLHEDHLRLFSFVGKMLGKAVYEGIVVDVPFATFFLNRVIGQPFGSLYSPIDELASLDAELYKSLTYIKHYEGDVSELDLTFSMDQDFMGKIETYELEPGGKSKPVTRETRIRYIHEVANFRMKTQIEKQAFSFICGFRSLIPMEWCSMFSAAEFQRLISGDNTPIDLQDLRHHTKYFGGFHNNHRVVCWLWDILEKDFTQEEHRLFLKFVTSCSKPPLLGFANLEPPFSIRCVEVADDQDLGDTVGSVLRGFFAIRRSDPVDRLPTSSTCFNLLKLPNYQRRSTLREKLRYAICSNPGFELS